MMSPPIKACSRKLKFQISDRDSCMAYFSFLLWVKYIIPLCMCLKALFTYPNKASISWYKYCVDQVHSSLYMWNTWTRETILFARCLGGSHQSQWKIPQSLNWRLWMHCRSPMACQREMYTCRIQHCLILEPLASCSILREYDNEKHDFRNDKMSRNTTALCVTKRTVEQKVIPVIVH